MIKIAVFGSAFDPPTLGHLNVINQCLDAFDEVWLVPSYRHAFSKKMSAYFHRCEMTKLFCQYINKPSVKVVACEVDINPLNTTPVYSLDLLRYLKNQQPLHDYALIIGPDNHAAIDKFYQADVLKTEFSPFVAHDQTNIRSTKVRNAVKNGLCINEFVPGSIAQYINQHNLFS